MDYFSAIRVNLQTTLNLAVSAHKSGQGFLMNRYGDGEYLFLEDETVVDEADLESMISIHFGPAALSKENIDTIRKDLFSSIFACDVIGLPHVEIANNLVTERWKKLSHLIHTNDQLGKFAKATSPNIHIEILANIELFKEFLKNFNKAILITSRDIGSRFEDYFDIETHILPLPTEYRSIGQGPKSIDYQHYPEYFEHIKLAIENNVKCGDLVLVGGGILGKIYGHKAKMNGAIVLDLGSAFDVFAGINSRTYIQNSSNFIHNILPDSDVKSRYLVPTPRLQASSNWAFTKNARNPLWKISSINFEDIKTTNERALFNKGLNHIFCHSTTSSAKNTRFTITNLQINSPRIFSGIIQLPNPSCNKTCFYIELCTTSAQFTIELICNPGKSVHFVNILPELDSVYEISFYTKVEDQKSSSHGWCYYKDLEFF